MALLEKLVCLVFFLVITLFTSSSYGQVTYYAIANGNWNTPATWSTVSCSGVAATTVPGATDNVIICTGRTVTYNSANTTIRNLTIEPVGVLTISGNNNITLNSLVLDGTVNGGGDGDLRIGNLVGSTLSGVGFFSNTSTNCRLRLQNNVTILVGTDLKFNANSRFQLNNRTATNNGRISILDPSEIVGRGTFINNSATAYFLYTRQANFPSGGGNRVTLTATATGNTVEFGSTGSATVRNMDAQSSYHHLIISGSTPKRINATTTTVRGNLTISNGSTLDANTGVRNINVAGNWINNLGGGSSFVEQNSLVTFNGSTNNQTISPPAGASGETFYDLTINNTFGGGSVTSSGNITITNGRTLRITAGIFDMGINTLTQASGNANLTATGGDLRLAKLATTLPELTGTYNITGGTITFNGSAAQTIRSLNTAPANYHNIVLSGAGTKTLAGNITVRGDWTNSGATLAGAFTVTFAGSGLQTITNTAGEVFHSVTVNTTGPLTHATTTDVTIGNTLTMTAGNININGRTLTLGNGSGATLVRTTGTCFGGTFRRYFPVGAISSTVAPLYGLFPVGTSINYRPVEINATANPTTAGNVSVLHTDGTSATDVVYTDNEGDAIERITDMRSAISSSLLAGGTYTLSVSMTSLSSAGLLTDLKMETVAGPPFGVGTTVTTAGTVTAPTVIRSGLNVTQLNNTFVVGSKNRNTTPLVATYYSRRTGNWNDATVGNATWSLTDGGPSCNCVPINSSLVFINPTHTVTLVATPTTADNVTVRTGAILNGSANLTVNVDLTTQGTGSIAPTAGTWTITRNLTIAGISNSSSAASLTIGGNLSINANNTLTTSAIVNLTGNLSVDGTLGLGNTLNLTGIGATISGSAGAAAITGVGTIAITGAKSIAGLSNLAIQPTISLLGGTTVTNLGTITHTGNLTGANATTSIWVNSTNAVLNTTGAVLTTGVLDASASPNTVNYNGAGAQTVKAPSTSYFNLIISNGGTKTSGGNMSVTNQLTIQDAAIFNSSTNTLNGTGDLVMTGTSELQIAKDTGVSLPELTGVYSLNGGTVTMNHSSAGTYTIRAADYNNLFLNGSGSGGNGSNYDFEAGASVINNMRVILSGTSRFRNTNGALVVGNDFIFNSSSTNTSVFTNDITVGTFTLTAGLINAGSAIVEITLAGGWTRNGGTFTPGTSTVLFSGDVDQTINGSTTTTFANFEINNTGPTGVQLNQPISVSGVLTFTEGELTTTSTNLLTLIAGSSVASVSNASFVNGPMAKAGTTAFIFPVGKDGVYRPIEISTPSAVGTFQAEYFHANPTSASFDIALKGVGLDHVGAGEYWVLNVTSGTPSAFVTLSWDTYSGVVNDLPNLRVARWNGALWVNLGNGGTTGAASPSTGTVITSATVTSANFGPFTLASANGNNPLPIELLYFNASTEGDGVLLRWETASELNNDFFTVERLTVGDFFDQIATVKGSGTINEARSYQAYDFVPNVGKNYYRLKQTDFDGKFTYSKIVMVDFQGSGESVSVYPNPTNQETITVEVKQLKPGQQVPLQIRSTLGVQTFSAIYNADSAGNIKVSIQVDQWSQGLYFIQIGTEAGIQRKMIIE